MEVTLFRPVNRADNDAVLTELYKWLDDQAPDGWCIVDERYVMEGRTIASLGFVTRYHIEDPNVALMFKLTWGGQ